MKTRSTQGSTYDSYPTAAKICNVHIAQLNLKESTFLDQSFLILSELTDNTDPSRKM